MSRPGWRHGVAEALHWTFVGAFGLSLLLGGGGPHSPGISAALSALGAMLLGLGVVAHLSGLRPIGGHYAGPALLLMALVLLPLVQMLGRLSGGDCAADIFRAAGCAASAAAGQPPLETISLDPQATRLVAAGLLMPAALFVGLAGERVDRLGRYIGAAIGVAALGGMVALAQGASGTAGRPDLFHLGNRAYAGLFANSNHHGTMMLSAALLAAILLPRGHKRRRIDWAWAAGGAFGLLAIAAGSRGAALFFAPVMIAIALVRHRATWGPALIATFSAMGLLAVAALLMPGADVVATLAPGEIRVGLLPHFLAMARAALPWGIGLGAFRNAWGVIEPLDSIDGLLLNHAHNDWLEWVIEGGVPAALMLVLLLLSFAEKAWRGWRTPEDAARRRVRGGMFLVLLIGLASVVDYPLRTLSMQAVGLLAIALLWSVDTARPTAEVRRLRPALPARVALLLAAAVMAAAVPSAILSWRLFAAERALRQDRPDMALALAPGHAGALERKAGIALDRRQNRTAQSFASAAVGAAPLRPYAIRDLALARERAGLSASDSWAAAAGLGWNEPLAQYSAFAAALAAGDPAGAALRADALLRASPRPDAALDLVRIQAETQPAFRAALMERLRRSPPWRHDWFTLWPKPVDRRALGGVAAMAGRPLSGVTLEPAEARALFNQLIELGDDEGAARLASGLAQRGSRSVSLAGGDPSLLGPLDWTPSDDPDLAVFPSDDGVEIRVPAFKKGVALQRWSVVSPGRYQMKPVVDADGADLEGLSVVATCPGGPSWRWTASDRSPELAVTARCPLLRWSVEIAPLDRERSVRFGGAQLVRKNDPNN